MMELKITSMTPADRLYAYNQSSQLEGQTGCIGHLRGDFGSGQEFYTSWFDHRREYKTDEFKAELDEVVNTLREKNGLLCTRDSMTRFCYQNPEAEFEGNYCAEYGFKVQTPQHTYMLRCNPNYGDYNFYLYAYVARFLEHHMEKAKQGIRFITPGYKELFRIPDGDHIRIFTGGGETRDRTCRFIDETHFETSGGYSSALYHICEFAERLEQTHGSVIPLRSSLPVQCFSVLPSSGELILLTRGEKATAPVLNFQRRTPEKIADLQRTAMEKTALPKRRRPLCLPAPCLAGRPPLPIPETMTSRGSLSSPGRKTGVKPDEGGKTRYLEQLWPGL